jgi:hypothetical protein
MNKKEPACFWLVGSWFTGGLSDYLFLVLASTSTATICLPTVNGLSIRMRTARIITTTMVREASMVKSINTGTRILIETIRHPEGFVKWLILKNGKFV